MPKVYIGIDNGVTGALSATNGEASIFRQTPVEQLPNPTKSVGRSKHLIIDEFKAFLDEALKLGDSALVIIERPFSGANVLTVRTAWLCHWTMVYELRARGISYEIIDSKQWQRPMLPALKPDAKAKEKAEAAFQAKCEKAREKGKPLPSRAVAKVADSDPRWKILSAEVGTRLFPQHAELIKKQKDADALLIAEWARRDKL